MLKIGDKAPDFTLKNEKGEDITLSQFNGKKVVLYFYPKDNTPGCTKQACEFRDNYEIFEKNNVVVIGISKDNEKSHINFKEKFNLPFVLLSDIEREALELYDVWKEKNMYGKLVMGIQRNTFVIDENGIIEQIFVKVKAQENPKQVLEYLGIGN
ncbi:MAG: thioredoxin-dependent thiol peroxidase [Oscillospiraceae bacterium]